MYGTAAPPVGNAGSALGVEAVRGEIEAGAGEGAPAKSAKSAGVNVGYVSLIGVGGEQLVAN